MDLEEGKSSTPPDAFVRVEPVRGSDLGRGRPVFFLLFRSACRHASEHAGFVGARSE